jgi:pimeloyl-ACP methyl ester carboxylesterase
LGRLLLGPGVRRGFRPQRPPDEYIRRAGTDLILRPADLIANAEDLMQLKDFVTAQAPNYSAIEAPTEIIVGDADPIVSPQLHSKAIARVLPHCKLVVLPGIGHMVHDSATDVVVNAIDKVAADAR